MNKKKKAEINNIHIAPATAAKAGIHIARKTFTDTSLFFSMCSAHLYFYSETLLVCFLFIHQKTNYQEEEEEANKAKREEREKEKHFAKAKTSCFAYKIG